MTWNVVVDEAAATDPLTAFLAHVLRSLVADHAGKLDGIQLWVRNGPGGYRPTGFELGVDGEPGPPDEAAKIITGWIKKEQDATGASLFRIVGLGGDKRGAVKKLFQRPIDLNGLDDNDSDDSRRKEEKGEVLETLRIVRDLLTDFHGYNKDANRETREMTKEYLTLAKEFRENASVKIELAKLEHQEYRDRREHEYEMSRLDHMGRMGDKFAESVGPMAMRLLERIAVEKLNLDPKTITGPYAQRLTAIIGGLSPEQRGQAKDILGERAWEYVEHACKAKSDDEFKNFAASLEKELGETSKEKKEKLEKLAGVIGPESAMALLQLINEAL